MRSNMNRMLARARQAFTALTVSQRMAVLVGTAALLVGAFLVVRWVSTPSMAPLYTDLAGADASAVVDELEAQGVPYEITDGGATVMVPRSDVYSTRIALSGQGLPAGGGDTGYGLLDDSDIATSEFKEQTDFKRAMEGELATTVEAIDGVETAVVHLSIPEKEVFSDDKTDPTASVLVDTAQGSTLAPEQVQAVVHLVASSVEGLDPKKVTVADATGTVLTNPDAESGVGGASTQATLVKNYQEGLRSEIQAVLDRVLGPGNSTATVTAVLNFDTATTDSRTYIKPEKDTPAISESTSTETYNGPAGGANNDGGVVGPDGQMDPNAATGPDSSYENSQSTRDNPVGEVVEHREVAPGEVESRHVAVVLDTAASAAIDEEGIQDLVVAAIGINLRRGDSIEVSKLPFDRSAEEAAAEELAAAEAADARKQRNDILLAVGLSLGIALLLLIAWLQAHRRAKRREKATTYVVEQLRADAAARATAVERAPAVAALEAAEEESDSAIQDELQALVERQPEDVAALLRGWLVEPR